MMKVMDCLQNHAWRLLSCRSIKRPPRLRPERARRHLCRKDSEPGIHILTSHRGKTSGKEPEVYPFWWLLMAEIRRSPVEVGSNLSYLFYKGYHVFFYISWWLFGISEPSTVSFLPFVFQCYTNHVMPDLWFRRLKEPSICSLSKTKSLDPSGSPIGSNRKLSGWWFQPLWKILVKMGIFPK